MIHFHGGSITPDTCALKAWKGRHAFISFANAGQLALASEVTQSFALDNGAFSFWTKKRVVDWNEYYRFVERWAWPAISVSINHGRNQPMHRPAKKPEPLYSLSVSSL